MAELQISERLKKLLPALTKEEKQQLKENIEADGEVTDPICYWNDGENDVVIDGMHRWDIISGTDIPYTARQLSFDDYDAAELWILNHQLGRRNLLNPAAIRKLRGKLYNRLKGSRGGDLSPKCQIDTLVGDAAKKVSEITGVSVSTVKRDGARDEHFEKLTDAAQFVVEEHQLSDKDVKLFSTLSTSDQDAAARQLRTGSADTLSGAMKLAGVKPKTRKKAPKKPPRKLDRSAWFQKFDKSMGPIVKLVDTIAREVGEMHGKDHKAVKAAMHKMGDLMAKWMEVE